MKPVVTLFGILGAILVMGQIGSVAHGDDPLNPDEGVPKTGHKVWDKEAYIKCEKAWNLLDFENDKLRAENAWLRTQLKKTKAQAASVSGQASTTTGSIISEKTVRDAAVGGGDVQSVQAHPVIAPAPPPGNP